MSVEKKTIRSDIPGHHTLLNGSQAASAQDEARRLVIGRDISLNGDISSCAHLVIEGTVNAQSFQGRRMDIQETGFFAGAAQLQDAVIAGRFEGKLSVSGRLTVKSTGRLYGEVDYGTIECEAGARIEGRLLVMAPVVAEQPAPVAAAPQTNDNVENMFDAQNVANSDETSSGETSTDERPRVFRRAVGM
jgi:cytoskeletal protein CcmA (bactofilin family)